MGQTSIDPTTDDDDAMGAAPSLDPGRVVAGRFRIERVIGSGGMGTVHQATQLALDRRVALKVLNPALTVDRALVARFRREAKLMAGLRHANIVEVIDAGDEGDLVFLVMEFLTGTSLGEWIEARKPLTLAELGPLVMPIGRALSFVHARGIVHRDVKPDNVFLVSVEGGGVLPKLLDFGIARPTVQSKSITATGMILGTPAYMAPEQAWGVKEITAAADQWAFAAMLYEALCGEIPHQCDSPHALIVRRVSEPTRPLRDVCPGIDPEVDAVSMRALATEPTARFESMDALLAALEPLADARDSAPRWKPTAMAATMLADSGVSPRPTPPESVVKPVADVVAAREPEVSPSRWPRVAAAVAVAVAVATTGYAYAHRERATSVTSRTSVTDPRPTVLAATVTLSFDFSPLEARILLDGVELGAGHASTEVARGSVHALRVESEGYLPYVDALRGDGDLRISRSLVRREREAGVSPEPPTSTAHSSRPAHTGASPAARVPSGRRSIDTQWPP